ncbi:uncharacterized protein ATC70_010266 [Mucor velutinosus]|uniref:Uncharacterized protein n=1 Tax=Mucor velutinosus TaxID=708070 RepID=A0AAN7DE80_9FUNG|nr:hypothetical protein ATC70_010266 [Mucor velutinosus]
MESSTVFDSRRKSSSTTIVPPAHSKYNARKASLIPLKINTAGANNLFYDTGSMAEISPITVVSFKEATQDQHPKPSWIHTLKDKLKLKKTKTKNNSQLEDKQHPEKQHRQHSHQSSRIVRHSYSDPRLSPGSTAVGDDDDEEQQGYFSAVPTKKTKRSPRGWVSAVLMIVFGALIAVTFVLVGLGKALGGSSNVASVQSNSTTTTSNATSTTATVTDQNKSMHLPTAPVFNTEATVTVTKAIAFVHKVIKPTAIST